MLVSFAILQFIFMCALLLEWCCRMGSFLCVYFLRIVIFSSLYFGCIYLRLVLLFSPWFVLSLSLSPTPLCWLVSPSVYLLAFCHICSSLTLSSSSGFVILNSFQRFSLCIAGFFHSPPAFPWTALPVLDITSFHHIIKAFCFTTVFLSICVLSKHKDDRCSLKPEVILDELSRSRAQVGESTEKTTISCVKVKPLCSDTSNWTPQPLIYVSYFLYSSSMLSHNLIITYKNLGIRGCQTTGCNLSSGGAVFSHPPVVSSVFTITPITAPSILIPPNQKVILCCFPWNGYSNER